MKGESLSDQVARIKACWLNRVMYASKATSVQKCCAYIVFDHLNCVTLDCWPAQATIARYLGCKSVKTVQRATRGLVKLGLITLKPNPAGKSGYRYAPVFLPEDEDKSVGKSGQSCPKKADTDVRESFLDIHFISSSTEEAGERRKIPPRPKPPFNPRERGAIEIKVAEKLGRDGMEILARLARIDDAIVTRLCRAVAEGSLGDRDLAAARLAAEHVRACG
jgi:hypothetical protein